MMKLISVEWTRFRRNPLNLWIVGLFLLLMIMSALWSGLAAREFRNKIEKPLAMQESTNAAEIHDIQKSEHPTEKSTAISASSAAPLLQLPVLGGLALNTSQIDLLSTSIKISTRNRHTDGRTGDQLFNPIMHELGLLDFATVLALLTPLVIIALTYGLVQEDRESGVWRLVCTQTSKPWLLVFAALSVRYSLIGAVITLASLITFALDPDSTLLAICHWLLMVSLYSLVWFCIAGLFLLLPVSSGAAAIAMIGVWLIVTFAVPAGLGWAANKVEKMPSRLTTIIAIRHFQEQSHLQRQVLLADWYAAHTEIKHPAPLKDLPLEIASLPANLQLDSQIRPLMYQFDEKRKIQFEFMERWSGFSPALGVILMADRLTGIDAPRYAEFIQAVNRFEDQWRSFFVPMVMSNAAWSDEQQKSIPQFSFADIDDFTACFSLSLTQLGTVVVLLTLIFVLRRHFAKI